MGFKSRGVSKLEYGSYLAACLAYLAHRQRDRVGIITFDSDIVTHVPPSAKHFDVLLHTLDRAKAERPGQLAGPVNKVAEHFRRRSVLVLISDFYEEPDVILEAIKPLRFLGNELIVFHVLDPAEIDFTYDDASSFEDLESGEQLPVVPGVVRRRVSQADRRALERARDEVLRASDRLHAAQHGGAARPRAVQLPVEPRTADEGAVDAAGLSPSPACPFLAPCFLVGLGAIAIPILIHLIQRERKRVVQFPSLMFLRRIPYQSVRRRRIRHWLLLAMRVAAIALIVLAFARPFFQQGALAAAAAGGAREVVILLDQSASMGYGDHWQRAQDAARQGGRGLGADDKRDARAVRPQRRGEHARDLRSRAARRRDQRREGRLRRARATARR